MSTTAKSRIAQLKANQTAFMTPEGERVVTRIGPHRVLSEVPPSDAAMAAINELIGAATARLEREDYV